MLSAWKQMTLLVATLAGMLLTAKVFAKSEGKTERKGEPSVGEAHPSGPATTTAVVVPEPAGSTGVLPPEAKTTLAVQTPR